MMRLTFGRSFAISWAIHSMNQVTLMVLVIEMALTNVSELEDMIRLTS